MFGSQPLHDWASHDGDAFSYGCVVMREADPPPPPDPPMRGLMVGPGNAVTLDEMWQMAARESGNNRRI